MKIRVLLVLLVLSLAANVWLIGKVSRSAGTAPSLVALDSPAAEGSARAPAAASHRSAANVSAAVPAQLVERLRVAKSDAEIRMLIGDLRAAGTPGAVIRAIVNELLNARFASRQPTQPFWRRNTPTPEFVAATQALATERQALLESLIGDDASPAATLTAAQREQRYGRISDEKLNAVARLEREYDEMRARAGAERETNIANRMNGEMDQQRLLELEKLRDLAAILSPEELEQYELRNTQTAQALMRTLGGVDVTAEEFAALYRLQRAFELQHPWKVGTGSDFDALSARMKAQSSVHAQAEAILPPDRYHKYLESVDFNYASLTRFAATYPQLTRETMLKVHRLQTELQNAMQPKAGGSMAPDVKTYNARLVELLGPEIAAAYQKQPQGRLFTVSGGG